jgi:hypothetical protein
MRVKPLVPFVFIFFLIGFLGLFQFSRNVRSVDAVGLFFSGFACGAAVVALVKAFSGKSRAD